MSGMYILSQKCYILQRQLWAFLSSVGSDLPLHCWFYLKYEAHLDVPLTHSLILFVSSSTYCLNQYSPRFPQFILPSQSPSRFFQGLAPPFLPFYTRSLFASLYHQMSLAKRALWYPHFLYLIHDNPTSLVSFIWSLEEWTHVLPK